MGLSLSESQAVNEIAQLLYSFLPGEPHPRADPTISFRGAAKQLGLSHLWTGGSKLPAIVRLLEGTLEEHSALFCDLILTIVRRGLTYRRNKGHPITREEIRKLNELLTRVHFKIPDLWDPTFLDSLPVSSAPVTAPEKPAERVTLERLKQQLMQLNDLDPSSRGIAFEQFLRELFEVSGLCPRPPFRLTGEQIDGSFEIDADIYLVEAKWHKEPTGQSDLLVFREKVESKSSWTRGLFISYSGFTNEGLQAFARGRSTNIIGMSGQDLYFILEGEISLADAIKQKVRRAAETGEFYVPIFEITRQ